LGINHWEQAAAVAAAVADDSGAGAGAAEAYIHIFCVSMRERTRARVSICVLWCGGGPTNYSLKAPRDTSRSQHNTYKALKCLEMSEDISRQLQTVSQDVLRLKTSCLHIQTL